MLRKRKLVALPLLSVAICVMCLFFMVAWVVCSLYLWHFLVIHTCFLYQKIWLYHKVIITNNYFLTPKGDVFLIHLSRAYENSWRDGVTFSLFAGITLAHKSHMPFRQSTWKCLAQNIFSLSLYIAFKAKEAFLE